jgi:RNA polymerase sigma-70 factor (ECF subfamily)
MRVNPARQGIGDARVAWTISQPADPSEREAWIRSLLDDHEAALLAYATRLLAGDVERARDVVQDTFIRVLRADATEIQGRIAVWLFTVCRNRALDVRAKEKPMLDLDRHGAQPEVQSSDPLVRLEAKDSERHIAVLLDRLPENQREVLRLKFQHGLSYKEIGEVTGHTVTNVGFLIHRGIKTLRERLAVEPPAALRKECAS